MTTSQGAEAAADRTLEAEIERTREQLGETVEELIARVDVKSRARDKVAQASGRLKAGTASVGARAQQATPEPVRRAVTKGAKGAREQWIPLTIAAGALTISYLVLSQVRRRQNACC